MLEEPEMPSFNVLVVDDNETNRTVLENMLSAWGMRVTLAEDGQDALDLLMAHPKQDADFDLALDPGQHSSRRIAPRRKQWYELF